MRKFSKRFKSRKRLRKKFRRTGGLRSFKKKLFKLKELKYNENNQAGITSPVAGRFHLWPVYSLVTQGVTKNTAIGREIFAKRLHVTVEIYLGDTITGPLGLNAFNLRICVIQPFDKSQWLGAHGLADTITSLQAPLLVANYDPQSNIAMWPFGVVHVLYDKHYTMGDRMYQPTATAVAPFPRVSGNPAKSPYNNIQFSLRVGRHITYASNDNALTGSNDKDVYIVLFTNTNNWTYNISYRFTWKDLE